jgi:NAD(P)-dependent dehydrogenase (short-subunit alcohol dehydrogenase family)
MNAAARPVLVSGAGSGIGLATVRALLAAGHPVFAGARRPAHLQMLRELGATALPLDVRDPAQVQAAAAAVQEAGQGLYGLVHSAGVGGIGLLASWPDADVLALFDTNVFGPHRLTNALLPALLASRGRIVCIGSQGGSITMPFMGPYTMSKYALEAYAACLRQELSPHGVAVSIVQPGAVATDIGDNGREGNVARLQQTPPPFDAAAAAALQGMKSPAAPRPDEPESASNRRAASPEAVAARVREVLHADAPALRHLFGTRWEGDRVIAALSERLIDAARSPSHRWSEAEFLAHCQAAWRQSDPRPDPGTMAP